MRKGLWMSKDAGNLTNGEITFDNIARIEVKRSQQWFMDGSEAELMPNKKQALEYPTRSSFAGVRSSSVTSWENTSSYNSIPDQLGERLLDTDSTQSIDFGESNVPPVDTRHCTSSRDIFGNMSSFVLSMSHPPKDSMFGIDYGGMRKVKVSEVRDSENLMPTDIGSSHAREVGDGSVIMLGESYDREDDFLSLSHSFTKADGINLATGHVDEADSSCMPMSFPFSKSNINIMSMPDSFFMGDNGVISMENQSNKDNNMISMSHANKGHPLDMSGSNTISFSGHHNYASTLGRMICNNVLKMGQTAGQRLEPSTTTGNPLIGSAQDISVGSESAFKKKEKLKKMPFNIFPSNVRSLLSTGIFDEIPVKYSAWSQEIVLHGIIKDAGYLCGCQTCNFSKVINAYEFERHAGCKTKHPNNHIYFDNGKTIYGVAQELRSTPENMLFDVIQNITGSPINQKSFRVWKESFLAATCELRRIYCKDEKR